MKFLYLWPLFLLILVPVIILMYILKQKSKDEKVPSLYLWKEMVKNDKANIPWEKLKKDLMLFLQILTLLVLLFALMSPYFLSSKVGSGKVTIILDTSVSMNTMYDDEMTRFQKAQDEAVNYIKKLKNGTEITLITSDRSATLYANNSQEKNEIIDKIKNLNVSTYPGDANYGTEMVKTMSTDGSEVEVLVLTDSNVNTEQLKATVVDVYSDVENVSIDYVSHGYSDGKVVVLVKMTNYGKQGAQRDLTLYQDDIIVSVKEAYIPAGESVVEYFDDIELNRDVYYCMISGKDANDYDNICYDVLKEESNSRILLMTTQNAPLEKALDLIPNVTVTKSDDIDNIGSFYKEGFDLIIFDGMIPTDSAGNAALPPTGNVIVFGMECEELALTDMGLNYPVWVYGEESPVTQYLEGLEFGVDAGTFYDVNGNPVEIDTYTYHVPDSANAFMSYTDDYGKAHYVGIQGEKDGRKYAIIGFDIHRSDISLKMEFPILIYNLVTSCLSGGSLNEYVFMGGDMVPFNAAVDTGLPRIIKPDGSVVELSDFRGNFTSTDQYGFYQLTQVVEDVPRVDYFAVNYPSIESNITTHPSMIVSSEDTEVVTDVKGILNIRNFVIIFALILLGVEWILSLRR